MIVAILETGRLEHGNLEVSQLKELVPETGLLVTEADSDVGGKVVKTGDSEELETMRDTEQGTELSLPGT